MSDEEGSLSYWSEEAMRNRRLARGLRAIAATVIVGGMVIAALEGGALAGRATNGASERPLPRDAPAPATTDAPTVPATGSYGDPEVHRADWVLEHIG